jgi:hypothetical protein
MILLGAIGVVVSYSSFGKAHPRSPSVILAMSIGTLIVVNQLQTGSHSYGHFGGLSLILLVMASLGTLQPYAVLVTVAYFVLIYLLAGIFLDRSVGWPPAATFVIGCSSLTVQSAAIDLSQGGRAATNFLDLSGSANFDIVALGGM